MSFIPNFKIRFCTDHGRSSGSFDLNHEERTRRENIFTISKNELKRVPSIVNIEAQKVYIYFWIARQVKNMTIALCKFNFCTDIFLVFVFQSYLLGIPKKMWLKETKHV